MCNTFALCAMTKINRNANKMGGYGTVNKTRLKHKAFFQFAFLFWF